MSDTLPGEFVLEETQLLKFAFNTLVVVIRILGVVGVGLFVMAAVFGFFLCQGDAKNRSRHPRHQPATESGRVKDSQLICSWRPPSKTSNPPALIRLAQAVIRLKFPAHTKFGESAETTKFPTHNETIPGHSA